VCVFRRIQVQIWTSRQAILVNISWFSSISADKFWVNTYYLAMTMSFNIFANLWTLASNSAVLIGHNPRNPPTWPRYFLLHSRQYSQEPNSLTLKMEAALYTCGRKNNYDLHGAITQKFVISIYRPTIHLWHVLVRPLAFTPLITTYSMD